MGTFAELFREAGAGIPDGKKEEFRERVEKLFQVGGMMELEQVELYGKRVVSTIDFLKVSSDDMILFWGEDDNIHFSRELEVWFADLKIHYEKVMEEDCVVEKPLCWIMNLMEYADEEYYRIYTFSEFFQETIENLSDKRFLALWRIYDEMLHDPKMEEAGSVVFVPEGPE